MEAFLLFIFGMIGGFVYGILIPLIPYLYRKHRKMGKHSFKYGDPLDTDKDL